MFNKQRVLPLLAVTLLSALLLTACTKKQAASDSGMTVAELAQKVKNLGQQEVVLEGTIVGACHSGCKMWIADGEYHDGDLFCLVRAKDDAFKFNTQATGKRVRLTGYADAAYRDYCGDEAAAGQPERAAGEQAGDCAAPVKVEEATKGELQELTFFASQVEYLN